MNRSSAILYVEDDPSLAFITKYNLESHGYKVFHASDGMEAFRLFRNNAIDICILDVMLPEMDGFELALKIRNINGDIPVLFLTVKSLLEDRIKGLKIGADDFISKPFYLEELLLKIEIFLKRPKIKENVQAVIRIGKLLFDFQNLRLSNGENNYQMTLKEACLLRFLLERMNTVVKREDILKNIWGDDDYFLGRSMDVFISRLRKYFTGEENVRLENIHGVGFRMCVL